MKIVDFCTSTDGVVQNSPRLTPGVANHVLSQGFRGIYFLVDLDLGDHTSVQTARSHAATNWILWLGSETQLCNPQRLPELELELLHHRLQTLHPS